MKRTIRRYSLPLNRNKWETVCQLAKAYAAQKDRFLVLYGPAAAFALYRNYRPARDELTSLGHKSPFGLQSRMRNLALKDAFETIERQWLALAESLRSLIMAQKRRGHFNDTQAHYAFWILQSAQRMAQLVSSRAPHPPHFLIRYEEQRRAASYLRRLLRRKRGRNPRVRQVRSFALDPCTYRVFRERGRQYIAITTLEPGRRLIVPLTGQGPIRGNLRIVLDADKQRIGVHWAAALQPQRSVGDPLAVDLGVTEAMTDSDGDRWGEELGRWLVAYSDQIFDKGRNRNRLHALAKKLEEKGDLVKAQRIRKYNLGQRKQRRQRRRMRQTLENRVNHGLNELWQIKAPSVVIHEDLRHLGGRFKSRRLSRIVSMWVRGLIKDRLAFKASAKGFGREQVNAAYSSQTCPCCGFVHRKNRYGDRFQCLFCGHGGDADAMAALNLLDRWNDPDILLWTPKERVRAILMSRFCRRLEGWTFRFPPDQANFGVLERAGVQVPPLFRAGPQALASLDRGGQVKRKQASQPGSETPSTVTR